MKNYLTEHYLLLHVKMDKEILPSGDIEIEKNKFYHNTSLISLKDLDTEKLLVSNKISSGEKNYKYFIDYLHNDHKVKPLHIMLPKTSVYVNSCGGQTKWIYFLIECDDSLKKYKTIRDKVSADIKKEFDSEPVYKKEYLETKIKFHVNEVRDF